MESQKINRIKIVLVETVSRWCSNRMQPSLDILVKMAELLKVDPRQLINGGNID